MLAQLRTNPIIENCCSKLGVSRSSYYRMREQDAEFAKQADESIAEGTRFVNDVAESQLLKAIGEGNLTAIIFWLKNKHPDYKQRMFQSALNLAKDEDNNLYYELFGKVEPETEKLLESKLNGTNGYEPRPTGEQQ